MIYLLCFKSHHEESRDAFVENNLCRADVLSDIKLYKSCDWLQCGFEAQHQGPVGQRRSSPSACFNGTDQRPPFEGGRPNRFPIRKIGSRFHPDPESSFSPASGRWNSHLQQYRCHYCSFISHNIPLCGPFEGCWRASFHVLYEKSISEGSFLTSYFCFSLSLTLYIYL